MGAVLLPAGLRVKLLKLYLLLCNELQATAYFVQVANEGRLASRSIIAAQLTRKAEEKTAKLRGPLVLVEPDATTDRFLQRDVGDN
ncbi:hypothetical protein BU24DRAFT_427773 [Aaosphaeria arxii CBS 175.79]|uniref:Uncharacterized protein n=1 Tax=Aaosphaeria arxii CBS 175.79 TaxID=1450172 RepID=A0A6A5XCY4_9PLEO|nr:uncharacterized protein BU24DRAFT_427773 [Aaosphaeria arxii CBS 175.79]KAF2010667.1 hypothetical protein BU24DRAFT_427773 [Aaosphaeria arxii CBS 175.79]